jgi:Phage capsid family.
MTINEIKDAINTEVEAREKVIATAEAEKRDLTDAEKKDNEAALQKINVLKQELTIAELRKAKVAEEKKEVKTEERKFSLLNAIAEKAGVKPMTEETRAVDKAGREEMRKAGLEALPDALIVPASEKRATITATAGADVISTDIQGLMGPLRNALVLNAAGAKFMSGLRGNITIPSYSGTSAAWKSPGTAAADGAGTFSDIELTPSRLCALITVDKQFLLQDSADADAMLRQDIVDAISHELEKSILDATASGSGRPAGLLNGLTIAAAAAPTKKTVNALKVAVAKANIEAAKPCYITNSEGVGILETTQWSANSDRYLAENGKVGGYPLFETNAIPASGTSSDEHKLIFCDASKILIAQWGAIEMKVDPYTLADKDQVRIIVNSYWDFKMLRSDAIKAMAIK